MYNHTFSCSAQMINDWINYRLILIFGNFELELAEVTKVQSKKYLSDVF